MESLLRAVSKFVNGYMGEALVNGVANSINGFLFRVVSKFFNGYRGGALLKGFASFMNGFSVKRGF